MAKRDDLVEDLKGEIESLQFEAAHVTRVVQGCSSIPVSWVEIGGIKVGLDSSGNAVQVNLAGSMYGWDAEHDPRDIGTPGAFHDLFAG